jgi:hypothetical protein
VDSQRLFAATELANHVVVKARSTSVAGPGGPEPPASSQFLNPRFLGLKGELSSVALPLEGGKVFRIYLGGEGVDQVAETALSITSPFFKVEEGSLRRESFGTSFPVISVDLKVAANVPFGDYSVRLQSTSGEIAYLTGGITIDPGVYSPALNPVDDPSFFVTQHYRDVLGREPDQDGLEYWVNQLEQCGKDVSCIRSQRLAIANAFFAEGEFQRTGSFIQGLYKTLGRRPTFDEFSNDRNMLTKNAGDIERKQLTLALEFVRRPEFSEKYSANLNAEEFVSTLLENWQKSAISSASDRAALRALFDGYDTGRAAILSKLLTNPSVVRADYNRTVVLMKYFAYFRRDPDDAGFNFWVNGLQTSSGRGTEPLRAVACSFLSSPEYRSRFGMLTTDSPSDCSR